MKKIIALLLTCTMVMSMTMMVSASNVSSKGGTATKEVTATYNAADAAAVVYSVDITWSDLDFTYNQKTNGSWNTTDHKYDGVVAEGWKEGTGTISITNHSNTAIQAVPSWSAADGFGAVTMTFSSTALDIATADNGVNGGAGTAQSGTITVTPGGTLPNTATTKTTVGSITITIN